LGEAGKQNDVLLLEWEQVKVCFKVKGGEAQMAKFSFFGKLQPILHLCGVVCCHVCCSVMIEHKVQSIFGITICTIQFGIDYEAVTYFGLLSNMLHRIGQIILDYEKA